MGRAIRKANRRQMAMTRRDSGAQAAEKRGGDRRNTTRKVRHRRPEQSKGRTGSQAHLFAKSRTSFTGKAKGLGSKEKGGRIQSSYKQMTGKKKDVSTEVGNVSHGKRGKKVIAEDRNEPGSQEIPESILARRTRK